MPPLKFLVAYWPWVRTYVLGGPQAGDFQEGFGSMFFLACLLNIAISSMLHARSANTAHLVGALVGGLLGLRYAKAYFFQHLTSP